MPKSKKPDVPKSVVLDNYYSSLIAGIMAGVMVYIAVVLRDTPYRSYAEAFFVHLVAIMVILGIGVLGAWTVVKFHQRR
jgi:hypothetical protein